MDLHLPGIDIYIAKELLPWLALWLVGGIMALAVYKVIAAPFRRR